MNILLTGSNGFIGNHIINTFNKKYNIFCLDINVHPNSIPDYYKVNLLKDREVKSFIANFHQKIDIIINLASILVNSSNYKDIDVVYKNLIISESVIQIAKSLNIHKLIHFSSIAVYPGKAGTYDENAIIDPSINSEGLYGLSKFNSEVLFNFLLRDNNTLVYNLRFAQILGKGMRSDRIYNILKKELKEKNTITLYGNGERISNFIKIEKLVEIIDIFITYSIDSGTYNVGDKSISYYELANQIIKKYGNIKSKIIKVETGNSSKFNLDLSKLTSIVEKYKL